MILEKLFGSRLPRAHLKRLHSSTQPLPHSMTVNHDRISLLNSPNDYLNSILQLIDRSTQKITLSALYFGTGEPERQIIAAIHVALSDKMRPNLTCTCIFDFSRTTRPSECNDNKSSLDIFQPLLEAFGQRMRLLLYKMPERLGIFNFLIPKQLSEILGVYHCKFCVFDQTVILTGANMSAEYLINRQDRYMLIEQSPNNGIDNKFTDESELKNFLEAFVEILDQYCCHVTHKTLKVKYLDKNSKLQIAEPACKDGRLRNTLGSEINNLLQRKGFKKEGEIVESHESMTMTSFHPLVQHSKCGVFSESNHLCNLLFPPTAPILRTPSRPRGHMKERTEPITENIPLECSTASNEFENRNSCQCQWSKMVIASPYPSYLPHFMSSLLSASTSASASFFNTVQTQSYNSSKTCSTNNNNDDVTVQRTNSSCSTITKQYNINNNNNDKNDLHIDIESKCETAGFSSKKAAESNHRASTKSVNVTNSDELKYFSYTIDNNNDNNNNNDNSNNNDSNDNNNNNNNSNINDSNNNNNNNLIKKGCKVKFIIADERAHGFYKGKGVKQLIPKMHTHAFQTVLRNSKKIVKSNLHINNHSSASSTSIDIDEYSGVYDNVSICPYHRAGWTFHVKGIWLFASQLPASPLHRTDYNCTASTSTKHHTPSSLPSTTKTTSASYPQPDNTTNPVESGYFRPLAATYIGSSNLGERSCFRDFELGFVLRTNCPILTKKLDEECSRIEEHSSDLSVGFYEYVEGLKNATWYTPYLTKLLRSFL